MSVLNKRKILVAGNWKMNNNNKETEAFLENLNVKFNNEKVEVLLCVPYTNLNVALNLTKNSNVKIGAQNCHFKEAGAYTGEISPLMLKEIGAEYVILGHSERREYFNETDETVNLKLQAVLKNELKAVVCVGETLKQREDKITKEIISMQLKKGLKNISEEDVKNIVIAYEPIWAIGTGKTASKEQAQEVCEHIRNVLGEIFSKEKAEEILILYGGSVKAVNCEEIFKQKDIDGGLIGGASLNVSEFKEMISIASGI